MCSRVASSRSLYGVSTIGLSCGTSALVRKPLAATAVITTVDDLQVRNQLLTNTQIGGSLELVGTQSRDPCEVALYVRKSVLVDGLAQHGALRVEGDTEMIGALRVPAVHGPVTFDSSLVPVVGPAVSVQDGMLVDELSAGVQITSVFAAGIATIAGYNAGALAVSELLALLAPRIACVVSSGGTYTTLGFAYDSELVLTTYNWQVADSASTNVNGLAPTALIAGTLGSGGTSVTSVASGLCPAANLAVIRVGSSAEAVFPATPVFPSTTTPDIGALIAGFEDDSDTPPVGMQVFVVFSSVLGNLQYGLGVVTDASAQMFLEYTSIHVTLTGSASAPLPAGSTGGLIFDMRGRLLGVVQYGVTGCSGTTEYLNCIGGVKGRYIRHFLSNFTAPAVIDPAVTVSLPTALMVPARGITFVERGLGALETGGIAFAEVGDPVTTTEQGLVVTNSGLLVHGVPLGATAPNTPSFTDVIISSGTTSGETFEVIHASSVPSAGYWAETDFIDDTSLWLGGLTPSSFSAGTAVFIGAMDTLGFNNYPASNSPQYWAVNYALTDLASTQPTDVIHTSHGLFTSMFIPSVASGHLYMTFTFGGLAGVDTFLSSQVDDLAIRAAWLPLRPAVALLPPQTLLFVFGIIDQSTSQFTMEFAQVSSAAAAPANCTMQLKLTSPGDVSAGIGMTPNSLNVQITNGTTYIGNGHFNALAIQKQCAAADKPAIGPGAGVSQQQASVAYIGAATNSVNTATTSSFATALY